MPTLHLLIKGRVQHVYYRATAKNVADVLGIKGWIKNTHDHNVEAIITGTEYEVNKFIEWCWIGPRRAEVEEVIVTKITDERFETFKVVK